MKHLGAVGEGQLMTAAKPPMSEALEARLEGYNEILLDVQYSLENKLYNLLGKPEPVPTSPTGTQGKPSANLLNIEYQLDRQATILERIHTLVAQLQAEV